jgi:hypothetical protein
MRCMGMACGYEQDDLATIIRGEETIFTGIYEVDIYKKRGFEGTMGKCVKKGVIGANAAVLL